MDTQSRRGNEEAMEKVVDNHLAALMTEVMVEMKAKSKHRSPSIARRCACLNRSIMSERWICSYPAVVSQLSSV